MPSIGPTELIIVLVIAIVIFGPGKLSDLGGSLGKSIREFRRGVKEMGEEVSEDPKRSASVASKQTASEGSPAHNEG